MNINDFTSNIPIEDDYKKLNIMPILFDGHISIPFFVDNDKKRGYILSDPSHTHSKKIYNTNFVDGFFHYLVTHSRGDHLQGIHDRHTGIQQSS